MKKQQLRLASLFLSLRSKTAEQSGFGLNVTGSCCTRFGALVGLTAEDFAVIAMLQNR
jgi:hypothetical protein